MHFLAGRDVRTMAILFLLEVRTWLGTQGGRKSGQTAPLFRIDSDSAIGRLALIIVARICPHTAGAIIREVVDAQHASIAKDGSREPYPSSITAGDFIANPRALRRLHTKNPMTNTLPDRSKRLGSDVLSTMLSIVRAEQSRFVSNDAARLGHSICFMPELWFEPHRETPMLLDAWREERPAHETAFPGCFDRSIPAAVLAFCARVAARLQPGATDMLQDPHCRKPDWLRSIKRRGRPRKDRGPAGPLPLRPTRTQQLALAQFEAARKGTTAIRTIERD